MVRRNYELLLKNGEKNVIKQNKRNIGKIVCIHGHKDFNGRLGKVVGFRGDHDKGNPNVCVYVFSTKSVWPFEGSSLEWTGERITKREF